MRRLLLLSHLPEEDTHPLPLFVAISIPTASHISKCTFYTESNHGLGPIFAQQPTIRPCFWIIFTANSLIGIGLILTQLSGPTNLLLILCFYACNVREHSFIMLFSD